MIPIAKLQAPFPWFGGKSRIASEVWNCLGNIPNYAVTFGSLFSGIGGLDLGLERAGMTCKWQIEIDPYCRKVLAKYWPHVKRYKNVKTIQEDTLQKVDLIAGGFPCQPVSQSGRRKAQEDERWLWPEFYRIVRMVRPQIVLVENTPGLLTSGCERWNRAMGEVLGSLAAIGYDAEWASIPACALGAPHIRYRVFIVAYLSDNRQSSRNIKKKSTSIPKPERRDHISTGEAQVFAHIDCKGLAIRQEQVMLEQLASAKRNTLCNFQEPLVKQARARREHHAWTIEPGVVRMVHGVPNRMDRIRSLGNAVVPQVAELVGLQIMNWIRSQS